METMTYYLYDPYYIYTETRELPITEPAPLQPYTLVPIPDLTGAQVAKWVDWLNDWSVLAERPPVPVPSAQPWQIDQEKDRRTAMGFIYEGKAYLTESQSQMNDILGALADATAAITVDQAQPGDLRWADPRYDFAWSTADGTGVPMDAQTCLAFTRAAVRRKSLLVGAGLALKAMNPIPVDYMDDKYWPPMDSTAKAARK